MHHEARLFSMLCIVVIVLTCTAPNHRAQEGSREDPRRLLKPESQGASGNAELPFFSPSSPQGCEVNRLYLDDAGERVRKIEGSYVIVIGHLGSGEHARRLNR